ncbi:MAG: CPCC family cysteine-rich protein [Deltaproteobacteria bacterium]
MTMQSIREISYRKEEHRIVAILLGQEVVLASVEVGIGSSAARLELYVPEAPTTVLDTLVGLAREQHPDRPVALYWEPARTSVPGSSSSTQDESWSFEAYVNRLRQDSVRLPKRAAGPYRCPCCRFFTLESRGDFDICPVCFWEDDGQDDCDADAVRGGPNYELSLTQGRKNYAQSGVARAQDREHVRRPIKEERVDEQRG